MMDGTKGLVKVGCCPRALDMSVPSLNLKRVIITRDLLHRLCGYGSDILRRYLNDQVCKCK